jgi:hypothetical protein
VSELILERREQPDRTGVADLPGGQILLTPPISEDYWEYRVRVADGQAVVGFPKFNTIGIGFAVEEDWNTNLPYTVATDEIVSHIWHNRGKSKPKRKLVTEAVRMIQAAATEDREQ